MFASFFGNQNARFLLKDVTLLALGMEFFDLFFAQKFEIVANVSVSLFNFFALMNDKTIDFLSVMEIAFILSVPAMYHQARLDNMSAEEVLQEINTQPDLHAVIMVICTVINAAALMALNGSDSQTPLLA